MLGLVGITGTVFCFTPAKLDSCFFLCLECFTSVPSQLYCSLNLGSEPKYLFFSPGSHLWPFFLTSSPSPDPSFVFLQHPVHIFILKTHHFILKLLLVKFPYKMASLVAQMIKNLPAMQETQVQSLSQKDPLEKVTVAHSSILA